MATVNKDFKIKSGLIVEGTTATVNGNQVLTENASDQYIINLIGGETLVTSVESTQLEVINGELNVKANVFDEYGAAATAESNANTYTNNAVFNLASESYVNTAVNNAIDGFNNDLLNYTPTADLDTTVDGYGYLKQADLIGYATELYAYDAANQARVEANLYADSLINDGVTTSTNNWSAYKTSTEIGLAQSAAESYADTAVANLVDGAPALLDTLNELAAAIADNPNYATDVTNLVAGKQDTLTAGSNISIDGSNVISVTGLDSADISDFNTAALSATSSAYDAAGSATTAENNAKTYTDNQLEAYVPSSSLEATIDGYGFAYTSEIPGSTDSLTEGVNNLYYTDARATSAAKNLLVNAPKTNIQINSLITGGIEIIAENGVADSTTDDLDEGSTNLYFTDSRAVSAVDGADITPNTVTIDTYRKEEATQQYVASASTVNVHTFAYPYGSVKYLVRVVGNVSGTLHSQLTEILMTVDGSGNVAVTEYGTIYTSENPLASFAGDSMDGTMTALTATTTVSGCEIIAAATMLSWAD